MSDQQKQLTEKRIRETLGLQSDASLQSAAKHIMKATLPPEKGGTGSLHHLPNFGISTPDFTDYCTQVAQGIQWVHSKFPEQRGPKFVFFGSTNGNIKLGEDTFEIKDGPTLATQHANGKVGESYILIPYQEVSTYAGDKSRGIKKHFEASSRAVIGDLTAEELAFITGVEEAYHAVQKQHPDIRDRLQNAENALQSLAPMQITSMDQIPTEHDMKPAELDVIPILKEALAYHREKLQGTQLS